MKKNFPMNKVVNHTTDLTVAHCLATNGRKSYIEDMSMDDMHLTTKDGLTVGAMIFNPSRPETDIQHDWWKQVEGGRLPILKQICKDAPSLIAHLEIGGRTDEKVKALNAIKIKFPEVYKEMHIKMSMWEDASKDNEPFNSMTM
jgi:hypothetical protein